MQPLTVQLKNRHYDRDFPNDCGLFPRNNRAGKSLLQTADVSSPFLLSHTPSVATDAPPRYLPVHPAAVAPPQYFAVKKK